MTGHTDKAHDAEILYPDTSVEINGENVIVREFRYREGLRAAAVARPIIAGLRDLLEAGNEVDLESLDSLLGNNPDAWAELLAMSTGRDREWVESLSDKDGIALSLAFWGANGGFFTRRLMLSAAVAQTVASNRSGSRKSSTPSSEQATAETITTSASD